MCASTRFNLIVAIQGLCRCRAFDRRSCSQKTVSPQLLREVGAVARTLSVQDLTKETVQDALEAYFDGISLEDLRNLGLSQGLEMSRLQGEVEFFADLFASSALSQNP